MSGLKRGLTKEENAIWERHLDEVAKAVKVTATPETTRFPQIPFHYSNKVPGAAEPSSRHYKKGSPKPKAKKEAKAKAKAKPKPKAAPAAPKAKPAAAKPKPKAATTATTLGGKGKGKGRGKGRFQTADLLDENRPKFDSMKFSEWFRTVTVMFYDMEETLIIEELLRREAQVRDKVLAQALGLPLHQVRKKIFQRLIPDGLVDQEVENQGGSITVREAKSFFRLSPASVQLVAKRVQATEDALSSQVVHGFYCPDCKTKFDEMDAFAQNFQCKKCNIELIRGKTMEELQAELNEFRIAVKGLRDLTKAIEDMPIPLFPRELPRKVREKLQWEKDVKALKDILEAPIAVGQSSSTSVIAEKRAKKAFGWFEEEVMDTDDVDISKWLKPPPPPEKDHSMQARPDKSCSLIFHFDCSRTGRKNRVHIKIRRILRNIKIFHRSFRVRGHNALSHDLSIRDNRFAVYRFVYGEPRLAVKHVARLARLFRKAELGEHMKNAEWIGPAKAAPVLGRLFRRVITNMEQKVINRRLEYERAMDTDPKDYPKVGIPIDLKPPPHRIYGPTEWMATESQRSKNYGHLVPRFLGDGPPVQHPQRRVELALRLRNKTEKGLEAALLKLGNILKPKTADHLFLNIALSPDKLRAVVRAGYDDHTGLDTILHQYPAEGCLVKVLQELRINSELDSAEVHCPPPDMHRFKPWLDCVKTAYYGWNRWSFTTMVPTKELIVHRDLLSVEKATKYSMKVHELRDIARSLGLDVRKHDLGDYIDAQWTEPMVMTRKPVGSDVPIRVRGEATTLDKVMDNKKMRDRMTNEEYEEFAKRAQDAYRFRVGIATVGEGVVREGARREPQILPELVEQEEKDRKKWQDWLAANHG